MQNNHPIFSFLLVAALAAVTTPAFAGGSPVEPIDVQVDESARGQGAIDEVDGDKNPRVESALILDADSVAPGDTFRAGVLLTMDDGWHVYWRNSGDAGMATKVEFNAELDRQGSDTANVGPLRWPAPRVFERPSGNIVTFGYGGQVLLFSSIEVPTSASPGDTLTVTAEPEYLACDVECIPGDSSLTRSVDITEKTQRPDSASPVARAFSRAASRVPRTPDQLGIATEIAYAETPIRPSTTVDGALGIDMCPKGPDNCTSWSVVSQHDQFTFIPDKTSQVAWKTTGRADHPKSKRGSVIRLEGKASPNSPEQDERFAGVVHLENEAGASRAVFIDHELPRGNSDAETTEHESPLLSVELPQSPDPTPRDTSTAKASKASAPGGSSDQPMNLWYALLFAFLGGAILNLMPCVFPVLALKVSSFTKLIHEDRRHILAHGAAYTGGIVGSMLVLAGAVLGLRAAGTQVGWGFQFQNPLFPAVLTGVLVLFALNLFGVFEVNVSANDLAKSTKQTSGLPRSAGEGVLAVVLATPCSAPFLGTAVGFALAAGPATIIGVFAMLGFGLAAPFVLLTLMPGWAKVLPDPGQWMVVLRQFLGFALVGAAIWLIWIVGRTEGVDGMLYVLMFAGMVAVAAWLFGWFQSANKQGLTGVGALAAAIIIAGSGIWTLDFPDTPAAAAETGASSVDSAATSTADGINWNEWTRDNVTAALEDGNPVFVDFTADWCITCKVNERNVLSTKKVRSTLDKCGFTSFMADWTDGNESIRKKLAEHGKAGVPMYLVYNPETPDDPQVLPELLTTDTVVSALRKAGRC